MQALSPTRIVILLWAGCAAVPLLSWGQSQTLPLGSIISRMEQAQLDSRDHDVAYAVTREYQLSAPGTQNPSSNVVAQVNFVPPGAKDYTILKSEGSSRGESIVRKVLDHEAEMASHADQHAVTARNYNFALLGHETIDGRDCYVLQLLPKRETVELIRGKAWVDAGDFTIRRMEGSPAKSPSLWIKNLTVTINYADVSGVRVATSTKSVANIRFAGTHVLTSRQLNLRTSSVSAKNQPPPMKSSRRSSARRAAADSAVWVAR
jgi:Outer membrane lipoprotein-sorting protein